MAINFNLNSLGNTQTAAVTGRRRKTPYTLALLAQTPYARQEAAQAKTDAYNEAVLNQERSQFDRELNQERSQFNVSQAQNREIAKKQEKQTKTGQTIQGVQTGAMLGYLTRNAWLPTVKSFLPSTATTAAPATVAPAATTVAPAAVTPGVSTAAPAVVADANTITGAAPSLTQSAAPAATAAATEAAATATPYVTVGAGDVASAGASAVGEVAGAVAAPLAIIALGNLAREQWGAPNKRWYKDGKSSTEKFFDDPGLGLGSNVVDTLFGKDSEAARIPSQVGEGFSHFAGGPIGKAFAGDFKGSLSELATAPETTLQSMGVDKRTAGSVNAFANPWGYAYNQIDEGNWEKALPTILAPDPVTASLATGLGSTGSKALAVATGGLSVLADKKASTKDKALAVATGGLSSVFCFAAGTPMLMADRNETAVEDLDLDDRMAEGEEVLAIGKAVTDTLCRYRGLRVEARHAVFEDGRWIRVEDSPHAQPIPGRYVVYPVINREHLIVVRGIVFADLVETPLGWDVTDAERLDWLNGQAERNDDLRRRYADHPL
ncbi:MAG: hypothetical protein PHV00_05930 [Syntrophales bacterium]|nr:hypothetical protein [Syntrophales bacterium]